MRFKDNWPETVGGWQSLTGVTIDGVCRSMWYGRDSIHNPALVFGSNTGLWAVRGATQYEITPSAFSATDATITFGSGYGTGTYGTGDYSVDRAEFSTLAGRLPFAWTYDSWDESTLIVCASQQGISEWDFDTAAIATPVTNAPATATGIMVTTEQHLVAFGPDGNLRDVKWCSQGNRTLWSAAADNSAGSSTIPTGAVIRGWRRAGRGQYLIWLDNALYLMSYVGYPDVYVLNDIALNCGALSNGAIAEYEGVHYWMGDTAFWGFRGGQPEALPCPINRAVFRNLDEGNKVKAVAMLNKQFDEVWFFWPSEGASENNTCAILDTKTLSFSGPFSLARSAGTTDADLELPYAASTVTNKIYQHEVGETNDGDPITTAYATTPPIEIKSGEQLMRVRRIIADFNATNGMQISLIMKRSPTDSARIFGPYEFDNGSVSQPLIGPAGRQAQFKFQSHSNGGFFRVGDTKLDLFEGGRV